MSRENILENHISCAENISYSEEAAIDSAVKSLIPEEGTF